MTKPCDAQSTGGCPSSSGRIVQFRGGNTSIAVSTEATHDQNLANKASDEEVIDCLERAASRFSVAPATNTVNDPLNSRDEEVEVNAGPVRLSGHLTVPGDASGVIVFAHGSGSSRNSPRNRYVARVLNDAGLATLLFDLLTVEEEFDRSNVFDIALLARRLVDVTDWLRAETSLAHLPVGYFGASTGAGAALWAAAEPGNDVAAVVSRGGRPDLAGSRLAGVVAPTLLIVGGRDDVVLDLNRQAQSQLRCESRLVVIPGATHLFDEAFFQIEFDLWPTFCSYTNLFQDSLYDDFIVLPNI